MYVEGRGEESGRRGLEERNVTGGAKVLGYRQPFGREKEGLASGLAGASLWLLKC